MKRQIDLAADAAAAQGDFFLVVSTTSIARLVIAGRRVCRDGLVVNIYYFCVPIGKKQLHA